MSIILSKGVRMKYTITFIFLLALPILLLSQQVDSVVTINSQLHENSGIVFIDGRVILHNDSAGEAALHELDTLTGDIARTVVIENAINTDWEDICNDSTYIYIGDIGNNNGNRTDLRIYRILISDFLNTPNDTVLADTIEFSYADQMNFDAAPYVTNFDAEALIAYEGNLYVFTKNWGNMRSNIYRLPNQPGTYSVARVDSIDPQCLITGATYNTFSNSILLSGHVLSFFVIEISNFTAGIFSSGLINIHAVEQIGSLQVEGIAAISEHQCFLSSEEQFTGSATLQRFLLPSALGTVETDKYNRFAVYPNPVTNQLNIQGVGFKAAELFSMYGTLQLKSNRASMDVSHLAAGSYILNIKSQLSDLSEQHIIVIN